MRSGSLRRNESARERECGDGLVANQERDHGEHDRTGEAGEIPELTRAKGEVGIFRVPARVGIGQRGQEEGAGVGAHMQPIGHERNRSKQQSADDFGAHHRAAQPNHRPGFAFTLLVPFAQKAMLMGSRAPGSWRQRSWRHSLQIGTDDVQ